MVCILKHWFITNGKLFESKRITQLISWEPYKKTQKSSLLLIDKKCTFVFISGLIPEIFLIQVTKVLFLKKFAGFLICDNEILKILETLP